MLLSLAIIITAFLSPSVSAFTTRKLQQQQQQQQQQRIGKALLPWDTTKASTSSSSSSSTTTTVSLHAWSIPSQYTEHDPTARKVIYDDDPMDVYIYHLSSSKDVDDEDDEEQFHNHVHKKQHFKPLKTVRRFLVNGLMIKTRNRLQQKRNTATTSATTATTATTAAASF